VRFHHIGYAVQDIRSFLRDFFQPLFSPVSVTDIVPDAKQRVAVCFAELAGGVTVELIEPLGEGSPVASIIGGRRGGLYHLCYEVDDLDHEAARFRSYGCMPLGKPLPAAAFDGRRVVFLLTPQRDIIDLLEGPREA
jgi:methylmalonyl-CoA/ethylmalonyl-CoA epimerase